VSGSGISWSICKSAPRSRQIATSAPHHSVFYRPDALPATQPTVSKHWRDLRHCYTKSYAGDLTSLYWASSLGSQHDAARICCWARAPAADIDRQLVRGARMALSSKPAARRCCWRPTAQTDGRTDGRTDTRPLNGPCCAYYAGSRVGGS